jgi:cell division protein FtsQ
MKLKFSIRREVKIGAVILILAGIIAFAERRQRTINIQDVIVKIKNTHENHFLEEEDVLHLTQLKRENLRGADIRNLDLMEMERRIKTEPFIKDAAVYSDLKGNLLISVELRRPIARLVRNDGPDGYIAEDGTVMPMSDKFNARVVLISGLYVRQILKQENMYNSEVGKQLMELLNTIREDEFWNAQIAQLDIDAKAKITFYPQVGDEKIEFGIPDEQEEKLKKLKIYYKEIMPRVGWNRYARVNLEYKGQIVTD